MLISQYSRLPDNLKQEVADFIAFLSHKNNHGVKKENKSSDEEQLTRIGMAISEKALQEDWANEDAAHWDRFL